MKKTDIKVGQHYAWCDSKDQWGRLRVAEIEVLEVGVERKYRSYAGSFSGVLMTAKDGVRVRVLSFLNGRVWGLSEDDIGKAKIVTTRELRAPWDEALQLQEAHQARLKQHDDLRSRARAAADLLDGRAIKHIHTQGVFLTVEQAEALVARLP